MSNYIDEGTLIGILIAVIGSGAAAIFNNLKIIETALILDLVITISLSLYIIQRPWETENDKEN